MAEQPHFVFVDLDNSLVRSDLFVEGIISVFKSNPWAIVSMIFWVLRGRARFKAEIASRCSSNVSNLPYEKVLIEYLESRKADGARLILATASNEKTARAVADHSGLFDDVIASSEHVNLKGEYKLNRISSIAHENDFTYVGDSVADMPIWQEATEVVAVNPSAAVRRRLQLSAPSAYIISTRPHLSKSLLKQMRPHQWAKNSLAFVPLLTSHQYTDIALVTSTCLAFLSFCMCASGVYFLNDLLDVEVDRKHKVKRSRPLANGDLPVSFGLTGSLVLPLSAFFIAWFTLPPAFMLVLSGYYFLTLAYSFRLKSVNTIDVITLATLYTSRIVAGAAATSVDISSWLLAFSLFIFTSLAYLKRYIELTAYRERSTPGRGYVYDDAETIFSLGTSTFVASIVVLALFANDEDVHAEYSTPDFLWMLCPIMLYWGNRVWLAARRGKVNDDPISFAIKDRVSQIVALVFIIVTLSARFFPLG